MMTQTLALLLDAYRELNARKLFWITLILSGLFVLAFAAVGLNERGLTIFTKTIEIEMLNTGMIPRDMFYKQMFLAFGIGIWLSWIATGLALVSTSSIFPSLLTGGQIETMLSKPISRTRLFLSKFFTGLLFVFLQVSVFCVASFLVIGWRADAWMPTILLGVPIVLVFYTYLFAFMTLIAMITRSAIASLLLTALFWFFLFIINTTDVALLSFMSRAELRLERNQERLVIAEENAVLLHINRERIEGNELPDDYQPTQEEMDRANIFLPGIRDSVVETEEQIASLRPWLTGVLAAKTILPNTAETVGLLERYVMSQEDIQLLARIGEEDDDDASAEDATPREELSAEQLEELNEELGEEPGRVNQSEASLALQERLRSRSVHWIVGSSMIFVAFVLFIAGWIFHRRDF